MRETHHIWYIVSTVLGLLFIIWGALTPNHPLIPGDVWLVLPGILLFVTGLFGIFEEYIIERRILKYFSNLQVDSISLDKLSSDLILDVDYLRVLLLQLRGQGKLLVYFDSATGELMLPKEVESPSCSFCAHPNVALDFCPVCGLKKAESKRKKTKKN
ncbi:MAG: hypothetical protein HZR80_04885 [Candidatus Heimdallarchaeota archaeon]